MQDESTQRRTLRACAMCGMPLAMPHRGYGTKRYCKTCLPLTLRRNRHKMFRTVQGRYTLARGSAKARRLAWTLTLEEYEDLLAQPCHYCGFPLPETGVGLDRLNNARGYNPNNVVPCCGDCNLARLDQFTADEMRRHVGPSIAAMKHERTVNGETVSHGRTKRGNGRQAPPRERGLVPFNGLIRPNAWKFLSDQPQPMPVGYPAEPMPSLSAREAARRAAVSEKTIRNAIKAGALRAASLDGAWHIDAADLSAWATQRNTPAAPQPERTRSPDAEPPAAPHADTTSAPPPHTELSPQVAALLDVVRQHAEALTAEAAWLRGQLEQRDAEIRQLRALQSAPPPAEPMPAEPPRPRRWWQLW